MAGGAGKFDMLGSRTRNLTHRDFSGEREGLQLEVYTGAWFCMGFGPFADEMFCEAAVLSEEQVGL